MVPQKEFSKEPLKVFSGIVTVLAPVCGSAGCPAAGVGSDGSYRHILLKLQGGLLWKDLWGVPWVLQTHV